VVECLLAATAGKVTVAGNVLTFYKRNGTTGRLRLTYGATDGERTLSEIL